MSAFLVYLFCLVVGFVFVVASAVFGHLFGAHGHLDGSGGHAEAGIDNSDAPGVSVFSPVIMAAFVTAFGAFGLMLTQIEATKSPVISTPLSIAGAMAVAFSLVTVLRKIVRSTDSSSESRIGTLVNYPATVITPIPAAGVGEIAYVQSGSRYTAPAREEAGLPVANGSQVFIIRIVGSQFYVSAKPPKDPNPKQL